jgi:hypothetical protein
MKNPAIKKRKTKIKQFQLLLYKKYFSEHFNFPIENIEVEFFIVKRKLYESEEFVIKRIQKFKPASGKIKLKKAETAMLNESSRQAEKKNRSGGTKEFPIRKTEISFFSCSSIFSSQALQTTDPSLNLNPSFLAWHFVHASRNERIRPLTFITKKLMLHPA